MQRSHNGRRCRNKYFFSSKMYHKHEITHNTSQNCATTLSAMWSTRKSRPFYTLLHVVPQETVLWMQTDWCTAPRIHAVHRMLQQNTQLKKRLIITTRYTKNNLRGLPATFIVAVYCYTLCQDC